MDRVRVWLVGIDLPVHPSIGMGFLMNCLNGPSVRRIIGAARQIAGAVGAPVLVILMETFAALHKQGGASAVAASIFGIQWALRISAIICLAMVLMVFSPSVRFWSSCRSTSRHYDDGFRRFVATMRPVPAKIAGRLPGAIRASASPAASSSAARRYDWETKVDRVGAE